MKVCAVDDLEDGDARVVPMATTGWSDDIAVFRDAGEFYALDDSCTHEEVSLADGWIEKGEVECPQHNSRFALRDGAVTGLPATRPAKAHRVRVRDGAVWLEPGVPPDAGQA